MKRFLLLLAAVSSSCFAAQWKEIGEAANGSLDKVYVDVDSVLQDGDDRTALIMTVYEKARTNSHGFLMDRHIQKTAFDCAGARFVPIAMAGMLDGKEVAHSTPNDDWKNQLKPVPADPLSQRALTTVCRASVNVAAAPGASAAAGRAKWSSGSGIAVDREGYVLTNGHVVRGCSSIRLKGAHTPDAVATIDAIDAKNDLALLKTNLSFEPVAPFRSPAHPARLGEAIGVIGYPLTGVLSSEPKATFGQVNSVAGAQNDYTLLQISAPIQPGNSGGPVLDSTGAVIGVVVSQLSSAVAAQIGAVPQNVNFAIRGEVAQIFMTAHGVPFTTSDAWRKLETDEMADRGQKFTVFILCTRD